MIDVAQNRGRGSGRGGRGGQRGGTLWRGRGGRGGRVGRGGYVGGGKTTDYTSESESEQERAAFGAVHVS